MRSIIFLTDFLIIVAFAYLVWSVYIAGKERGGEKK